MTPEALLGGFANASIDAARGFRAALEVMARPGRIEDLCPAHSRRSLCQLRQEG